MLREAIITHYKPITNTTKKTPKCELSKVYGILKGT